MVTNKVYVSPNNAFVKHCDLTYEYFSMLHTDNLNDFLSINENYNVSAEEKEDCQRSDSLSEFENSRRHWLLRSHCEFLLFPSRCYSGCSLSTRYGSFLLHTDCIARSEHSKTATRCAHEATRDLLSYDSQLKSIIFPSELIKINSLDFTTRKALIGNVEKIIRRQNSLVMACFELARFQKREGIQVLSALSSKCGDTLEQLYLWESFTADQNPILQDITRSRYKGYKLKSSLNDAYLKSLTKFRALSILALNYGYVADEHGEILTALARSLGAHFKVLQLLCLERDIPVKRSPECNKCIERHSIPDKAWRTIIKDCPQLGLFMIFDRMPEHETIRKFLTRSMPLRYFFLSSGIRFHQPKLWDIHITFRLLVDWYSDSLESLSLYLYRNRECLDYLLLDMITQFPNLTSLEYVGVVHNVDYIERMCRVIKEKQIKLKTLYVRTHVSSQEDSASEILNAIKQKYQNDLKNKDVTINLDIYKL